MSSIISLNANTLLVGSQPSQTPQTPADMTPPGQIQTGLNPAKNPFSAWATDKLSPNRSSLKAGLIGTATSGALVGTGISFFNPHFMGSVAMGGYAGLAGGVAGAISAQTADTRAEALLTGTLIGAVPGIVIGLATRDAFAFLTATGLGAVGGAIGALTATYLD